MENDYFTFWIRKYGREIFSNLANNVVSKTSLPEKLKGKIDKEDYAFHYFWIVYCIVALNHFGLSNEQISFYLDLSIKTGASQLYKPSEILEIQKDNIPEIIKYINEDLKVYGGE